MKAPNEHGDGSGASGSVAQASMTAGALWQRAQSPSRVADYSELVKLRLSLLVLVVTAAGFCIGSPATLDIPLLLHGVLGTALVAFGANALNQVMERKFDRLMPRTANRPVAAGRISPQEAAAFGIASGICGIVYLALLTNVLAAAIAALTIFLYLVAYTPLKRITCANTLVGALPGALPPVIGFAVASGSVTTPAWLLFAILYFWQLPHFFAIAWMYREDYRLGGYRMLSVVDPTGQRTGRWTIATLIGLIGVSMLPLFTAMVGMAYAIGAIVLGIGFLLPALRLAAHRSQPAARAVLLASLAYLPLLMMLLLLDRVGA